jgi:hypothetical protein
MDGVKYPDSVSPAISLINKTMIKKLEETFDNLDPEVHSMVAFQNKINEIIEALNQNATE